MKAASDMPAHVSRDGPRSVLFRRVAGLELRGCRANAAGDAHPIISVDERERQMQHDAAHRTLDPDTEPEQAIAQRAHLGACALTSSGAQAQLQHQHISGGGQQHAQLVGHESRATRAVDLQSVVQLFNPVLHLTASTVDLLIQLAWPAGEVGDDKTRIILRRSAPVADDLRLDDHAAFFLLPATRCVSSFSVHMSGTTKPKRKPPRPNHQSGRPTRKTHVFSHRYGIVAAFGLQKLKDRRGRKPAIQTYQHAGTWECGPQPLEYPAQGPDRTTARWCFAGSLLVGVLVLLW